MKRLLAKITFVLIALCIGANAFAGDSEKGTKEEAIALVKKAAVYLKKNGKENAFAEFSKPGGQFTMKDLYLFAYNTNGDGIVLAQGLNPKLVGKNFWEIKDADGKQYVPEFVAVANSPAGSGWVDYKWVNPVTKLIQPKSSYIEKVGDVLIGCGIYK